MDTAILLVVGAVSAVVVFVTLIHSLQKNVRDSVRERERRKQLEGGQDSVDAFLSAVSQSPPDDPRALAARFRLLSK